jgi:HKD family nuclease
LKVAIHANSEAPIGTLIERLLEQADDVFIASAYISSKAIDTLSDRIKKCTSNGSFVEILFGLDSETDFKAVQRIYDAALEEPDRLRVRYTAHRAGRLFHPKVYFFKHHSICNIIIASANLTQAGHHTNEEMYCHLECASTHQTVTQFNSVRQVWFSEPFSAVLDEKILGARAGIEDQKKRLQEAEEAFSKVISSVGIRPPPPPPPEDILAPIRAALATGYLIAPTFSLSNLYVSVQDILKPMDGAKPAKENQVVVVQNRSSSLIKLLPEEALKEFNSLQRTARDVCESLSIPISAGLYVPETAHKTLAKNIESLQRKQSVLVNSLVKNRTAINKHLKDRLEEECKQVWQALHPGDDAPFPDELLPEIRKRVEERRKRLEQDPYNALRFDFQAYPHPLVLMVEMPNNLAWTLQKGDPDLETVRAVITILRGQIELLKGVTQWSKPSIIKRDYDRIRLLVFIKGKVTDALLRTVSSWVRDSQTKMHRQTTDQKKQQLARKSAIIKRVADEHLQWLVEVEKLNPKEAITSLLDEYYSLTK